MENNQEKIIRLGSTDLPASEDNFGIKNYKDSMVKFITSCNTPMTISIQGTWGTGKTSFMNMVKKDLGEDCNYIEFNTWQFSQFNMDNALAINMLRALIDKIDADKKVKRKALRAVGNVGKILGSGAAVLIESVSGLGNLGGVIGGLVRKIAGLFSKTDVNNPIESITNLKSEFEKCVKNCIEKKGKKRVVIFIDDLDRLYPRKAVELLEVLKNFLDCEGCVFVLAIDYDVVCKGVAEKYGDNKGNSTLSKKKGKDFFDKIIQVPFRMPVEHYEIDNYLQKCLQGIMINDKPFFGQEEELEEYCDLVKNHLGTNPRAIKRLVNSYQLLIMVVEFTNVTQIENSKLLLFAILCLQELDSNVYNAIIKNKENLNQEYFDAFIDQDIEKICELYPDLDDKLDEKSEECINLNRVSGFMEDLKGMLNTDGEDGLSKEELDNFKEILSRSAVTNASSEDKVIVEDKAYYYAKIARNGETQTIVFRNSLQKSASLGALAYVLIKQYIAQNDITADELNKLLIQEKTTAEWLNEGELTLLSPENIIKCTNNYTDETATNHVLTHYFMNRYAEHFINIEAAPENVKNGVKGMNTTFPVLMIGDKPVFVARYWYEKTCRKLISILGMEDYVAFEPDDVKEVLSAFSEDELANMETRKVGFKPYDPSSRKYISYNSFTYKGKEYRTGQIKGYETYRDLWKDILVDIISQKDISTKHEFDEFVQQSSNGRKSFLYSLFRYEDSRVGEEDKFRGCISLKDNTLIYLKHYVNAKDIERLVDVLQTYYEISLR